MDNQAIGGFIQTVRKQKNYTQLQLAEKLGVSDKAVSKWERGLSFPDITIIPQLSDVLGISLAEFFAGAYLEDKAYTKETVESIITQSMEVTKSMKKNNIPIIIGAIFLLLSMLTIAICVGVNIVLDKNVTWSLIVTAAIAIVWGVIATYVYAPKYKVVASIFTTSILTTVLLFIIQVQTTPGWFIQLGVPIVLIGTVWALASVFIYVKTAKNIYYCIAFELLAAVFFGELGINLLVSYVLDTPFMNISVFIVSVFTVLTAIFFLWLGYFTRTSTKISE